MLPSNGSPRWVVPCCTGRTSARRVRHRSAAATMRCCIGRRQKANRRVARHDEITVTPDDEGRKVVAISWTCKPTEGSMMSRPGVCCLRSNIRDLDAETLWRTSVTLIETVFRSLKSERGLRPTAAPCRRPPLHLRARLPGRAAPAHAHEASTRFPLEEVQRGSSCARA